MNILENVDIINYLPFRGPTLGTYEELAVMASSGIAPDSIPSGSLQKPVTNMHFSPLHLLNDLLEGTLLNESSGVTNSLEN